MNRLRLPNRRAGIRVTLGTGSQRLSLSTGEYPDGRLGEIFLDVPKEGTFSKAMMNAFAIAVSIGLQHGIPLSDFSRIKGISMEPDLLREVFEELEASYGPKENAA
jgi:hypothetical protein